MATMLPSEADVIVRQLSKDRLHVVTNDCGAYLVHDVTRDKVHLLPYQLAPDELAKAVAEFWEP
jgi:hypothetical protein